MIIKASIIAIGTEITSGEVSNSNAVQLSQWLEDLGLTVNSHLAVPDDRGLILDALNQSQRWAEVIVVTGGLGPTSDDITRQVIAEWTDDKLLFNDKIWQEMNSLYEERGLSIRPAHRHQCYFQSRAEILRNSVGTAHGFLIRDQIKKVTVVVLPGPPREIAGMWPVVRDQLKLLGAKPGAKLWQWICLGATESEIAEVVEEAMEGSGFELGFRASVPYVRVKVWIPSGDTSGDIWRRKVEAALAPWLVSGEGRDHGNIWFDRLQNVSGPIALYDGLSAGQLTRRLMDLMRAAGVPGRELTLNTHFGALPGPLPALAVSGVQLGILPGRDEKNFVVLCRSKGGELARELSLPFRLTTRDSRGRAWLTEMAFAEWYKNFEEQLLD